MRSVAINVVLVRTIYETNIGATSRAMANMGFSRLILVDPKTEITFKGHQAAATGQEALEKKTVYASWSEFYKTEPEGLRICFTARDGKGRLVRDFQETLLSLKAEHPDLQETPENSQAEPLPVYLIFGPEDWGLSAEDLELTHFACSIPTYGDNTSLNLAQATLLALFILRSNWGGTRTILEGQTVRKSADEAQFPEDALKQWLEEMGFDVSNRRINAFTVMRRVLLQNVPNQKEVRILQTVLHQGLRKLREYNELRLKMGLPAIKTDSNNDSTNISIKD